MTSLKKTKGYKKQSEAQIQLAICDYLFLKKYFFWRQNTIPVFSNGRFRSMPKYSKTGVPDIILVRNGTFVGIEVKTKKGVQSENQKKFQKDLEKAGGEYYLVDSLQEIQKIL